MIRSLICRWLGLDYSGGRAIPSMKTAFLCLNCELITWSGRCGGCGSGTVMPLAGWLSEKRATGSLSTQRPIPSAKDEAKAAVVRHKADIEALERMVR